MKTVDLRSVALALLVGGVLLVLGPTSAKANFFQFFTPTGSSGNGGPVSATADVTTNDGGTITVVLTNTLSTPLGNAGQALSDFHFTLSTAAGATSIGSQSGTTIDVASDGTVSPAVEGPTPTHWTASASGSNVTLTTIGNGQPINMILPTPVSAGYPSANSSITNGNFNPFIETTGTFTINAANVSAATNVTGGVFFSFGTSGENIAGVPEPGTLLGAGVVIMMGLGYTWRRRRANA